VRARLVWELGAFIGGIGDRLHEWSYSIHTWGDRKWGLPK
jgi:hypothetical protein